jgi:hypothetical protein
MSLSVPLAPPGVDINKNIEYIENLTSAALAIPYGGTFAIGAWVGLVVEGGDWDYKKEGSQYEDFGNFNYGVTGTALGFPPDILLRGAGAVQKLTGTSKSEWGDPARSPPYGDDPRDQEQIQAGIDYYNFTRK